MARLHGYLAALRAKSLPGTDLTEQSVPRLTSVAQPLQEMGWAALRTVLRLAKGETLESNHVKLATRLVGQQQNESGPWHG
ncbi:MAG TPA: substrate-binding domain-containing protein [Arthrobacter sp.]|nr:substrate-binding domain-containing protein [Arthrobacter sp.]